MKTIELKNRMKSYLKKLGLTKEEYQNKERVSEYYFYADHKEDGNNQNVDIWFSRYDDNVSLQDIDDNCERLSKLGYYNIRIYQYKRYYQPMKGKLSFIREPKSMITNEYKYM